MTKSVLWFRQGLRLHDNPALIEAINTDDGRRQVTFYPVFIFDGESAGTKDVGYNRMKFLLESLLDLDEQFKQLGAPGLFIFQGKPTEIFQNLHDNIGINKICFEQDCEYNERDNEIKYLSRELGIEVVEKVSHTLWNPEDIIRINGGFAPLTYQMLLHTVNVLGLPPRPVNNEVDFSQVNFGTIPEHHKINLRLMKSIPSPEDFLIFPENTGSDVYVNWNGGERHALEQMIDRVKHEEEAFASGTYLPNQANVDLMGSPKSMSAALRFGCLSVRRFYYTIHDKFNEVQDKMVYKLPGGHHITGQLMWREYFYTMSINNPYYGQIKNNPICLNIPWKSSEEDEILKWKQGRTGVPIIDASMRQLLAEGWLHHTLRNLTATFLTRTGLWISWEVGLQHFLKYLLDADLPICGGNWMWVSSSAFETLLDSSRCSIISLAHRLDPKGEYIKRYVPELRNFPMKYIHEPWRAPIDIQEDIECIIGQDYPSPMIDIVQALQINCNRMKKIRESLIESQPHVRPSNEDEIRTFFWIADEIAIQCN
ncbi:CLUMA_CG004594, isoform A [Clunio marinus]|uniref:Cryptochrome-1 n=2 Tax=Clunio marinus TaxID=568069 RepID=A0A1J1HXN3_9DIPT|nr:CLUMA_CG004594, isoform A [Clunio marinus]